MTEDAVFWIASQSKPMTAAAVMMLETGLVDTERLQEVFHYYDSAGKGDIDWRDLENVLFPNKARFNFLNRAILQNSSYHT